MPASDQTAKFDAFNAWAERSGWPLRCDGTISFDAPSLREALAVWREKSTDRRWPSRSDMTPRTMKNFLADVAILDVVHEADTVRFRVRVMGSALDRVFSNAAGKFIDEIVPPVLLPKWLASLNLVLDIAGPVRLTDRIQFRKQDYYQSEELLAPLGNTDDRPDAILCIIKIGFAAKAAPSVPQTALG
jgi:hypothetical protein